MTPANKKTAKLFAGNGTEGMLDVILACTLIFLLISCLIRVGESESQEIVLPSVKLSRSMNQLSGTTTVKKNVITLKMTNNIPSVFFDNDEVSFSKLENILNSMSDINHIALRRDSDLACKWEDKVIMLCRSAGIDKVSIVIKNGEQG